MEATEPSGSHLAREHAPGKDIRVVTELEVGKDGEGVDVADPPVHPEHP